MRDFHFLLIKLIKIVEIKSAKDRDYKGVPIMVKYWGRHQSSEFSVGVRTIFFIVLNSPIEAPQDFHEIEGKYQGQEKSSEFSSVIRDFKMWWLYSGYNSDSGSTKKLITKFCERNLMLHKKLC